MPQAWYDAGGSGHCQYPAQKYIGEKCLPSTESGSSASNTAICHCSLLSATLTWQRTIVGQYGDLNSFCTSCGATCPNVYRQGLLIPMFSDFEIYLSRSLPWTDGYVLTFPLRGSLAGFSSIFISGTFTCSPASSLTLKIHLYILIDRFNRFIPVSHRLFAAALVALPRSSRSMLFGKSYPKFT